MPIRYTPCAHCRTHRCCRCTRPPWPNFEHHFHSWSKQSRRTFLMQNFSLTTHYAEECMWPLSATCSCTLKSPIYVCHLDSWQIA